MGVVAHGAPVFRIGGDPGGISTRAAVMMDRANEFADIHAGLSSLTSDGWQGRAADHFRYKFNLQIKGWLDAQIAFSDASTAYQSYASTLLSAQSQCDEIRSRWEQGRNAVEQAQNNKANARSQAAAEGGTPTFDASCDEGPGRSTMAAAEADFQSLVNQVNESGTLLINALNSGISKLPERTWMDSVARTFKSVYDGFVEATIDLVKLVWFIGGQAALYDIGRVICGYMTPEELVTKWVELPIETVAGLFKVLSEKPGAFFEGLAKGLFDYDTFIDDPGRWVGHALPDILITIATAGAGTGASAGSKAATGASRASRIGRALFKELTHIADLEDIANLSKLAFNKLKKVGIDAVTNLSTIAENAAERLRRLKEAGHTGHPPLLSSTDNTPSVPSSGAPSSPSHGGPSSPSYGGSNSPGYSPPNYPGYNSGGTPDLSGTPAPSHGNGGYSGNASHGGAGAADPNSRFAPPGQQSNGMSGATHSGDAGTTDPTSKYAPPTHQQNGTSGAAQAGSTPQASGAGTSGAATPAAGSHGTSGTASTGAGTAAPTAGAHGNPSGPAHNGMAGEGVSAADGLPPRRNIDTDEPRNGSSNDLHSSAHNGESYDAGNRKDSNHLNVDSRDFDKSSNGQYSPANNTGTPQQGGVGTDELVGAGVGRSEASVGAQGSYEHAGAFSGSDPSRVSHGADSFGGTADFGANAGHGGHGANGVTNSADTSGGLGSTPSGSHSTVPFTGHGGGHTGADSGTHGGSSTPAQGSYPAAGNTHAPSQAGSGSGAGHGGNHQAGQGANGHSGASSSHDTPHTPKTEPSIAERMGGENHSHPGNATPHTSNSWSSPEELADILGPQPTHADTGGLHGTDMPALNPDSPANAPHAGHGIGSTHKADAPDTAMDQADMPTREIDGNAVRRRAGAAAGNSGDFSWENNIVNKSGKADDAGLPQHASDPTIGADAPHAPHAGADGATDTSHAGHGDGASHAPDSTPRTTEPSDDIKNNTFYKLLHGDEASHAHHATPDAPHAGADSATDTSHAGHGDGASHTADGNTHAADPNTHTHEADGSADVSTGDKDKYGSAESDGAAHPTTSDDDLKNKSLYDILSDLESSHTHHSTPDAPHAPHAGADGATDMSHAGHGDTASHTADGKPHAADPNTHTHEADGTADVSTGNKDKYGSSESDGSSHTTDPEGIQNKKPHLDPLDGNESSRANNSTADASNGHDSVDELTDPQNMSAHNNDGADAPTAEANDGHTAHTAAREPVISDEELHNLPYATSHTPTGLLDWAEMLEAKNPGLKRNWILFTNDYTTHHYHKINGELRGPAEEMSRYTLAARDNINDFLEVLPKHKGTTFRGTHVPTSVIEEAIQKGVYRDDAFFSTSTREHIALYHRDKSDPATGYSKVFFEVEGNGGSHILPFSQAEAESEVLFRTGTDFDIVDHSYDPKDGYRIVLRPKK